MTHDLKIFQILRQQADDLTPEALETIRASLPKHRLIIEAEGEEINDEIGELSVVEIAAELDHNWSGWPGAWCLRCGVEDPIEACLTAGGCTCSMGPDEGPGTTEIGSEGCKATKLGRCSGVMK